MKLYLIIIFLIFSRFVFCQDYISYHKVIVKAESAIIDSNYSYAVYLYDSLFREYNFVFARHCYTATQTAIVAENLDKAFYFLKRGVRQGLTKDLIQYTPLLRDIQDDKRWGDFIENQYDSLRSLYLSSIDLNLRDEIGKLYALDQLYTRKVNESKFIRYFISNHSWKRNIKKLVERKLVPLIQTYGFPGEKQIGLKAISFKYESDSVITNTLDNYTKGHGFIGNLSAQYMLIHYFSTSHEAFNDLLIDEVKKGNLEPYQYASICDFQAKYGTNKNCFYNQWHRDTAVEVRQEINDRRKILGLESYEELKAKEKRNWEIRKEIKNGNENHIKIWTLWGGY